MRIEVITNPNSGRGAGPARAAALAAELLRRGHDPRVHTGQSREDAVEWARRAASGADRLVVVGGDGSMNAVLDGLPERPPPIALSPLGTSNLLGHELSLPTDPLDLAELVEHGHVQLIDTAHVNDRRSFLVWGFGIDGELMRMMEAQRSGPIRKIQYIPMVLRLFHRYEPIPQRVIADGDDLGVFEYGFVSGVKTYGSSALVLGPSRYDDGLWEMYLIRRANLPIGARNAVAALFGLVHRSPDVLHRLVRHVEVFGEEPAPVQIDGDYGGTTPVEFRMSGFQLPLLVPSS